MPYRQARVDVPKLTPDPGIVDDMVRQFADPYAYLRELVQNGIDAGASRLEVRIERDMEGTVRTSVDDDGCGMTRSIIEGPLLTLFESSKESDTSKIGKYGIGFMSVFATAPHWVDVLTRHEQEAWQLRLLGDHSFELRSGVRDTAGTTVTLVHTMTSEELTAHAKRAAASLHHWCRHAHLPIHLEIVDLSDPTSHARGTSNLPFATRGIVSVNVTQDGQRIVASIGRHEPEANEGTPTFAGFYNRGLTLAESTDATGTDLEGIRFKVDSPRLSHTLSRDAVRHDAHYTAALEAVTTLVRGSLVDAVIAKCSEAAASSDMMTYLEIVEAVSRAPVFKRHLGRLQLPLMEPIGGKTTIRISDLEKRIDGEAFVAGESSLITRALARDERPILRFIESAPHLRPILGVPIFDADGAFSHASAIGIEARPEDAPLLDRLAFLLRASGRLCRAIRLSSFTGIARNDMFRVVETDALEALTAPVALRLGKPKKRAWGRKATVFLDVEDAYVRLARRRAKSDPRAAAHLLCRAMLLVDGPLAKRDVDKLLAAESK
jgi:hypothetical protein